MQSKICPQIVGYRPKYLNELRIPEKNVLRRLILRLKKINKELEVMLFTQLY